MKKGVKLTYFLYSSILFIFLSTITLLATILSPNIDVRVILTSLMYVFLSSTFLFTLAIFSNISKISENKKKVFFISTTLIYAIGYSWAIISYLFTNQIIREQSIFFLYQIFPKTIVFVALFIMVLAILSLILITNKKIHFLQTNKSKRRLYQKLNIVGVFILITLIFILPPLLNVFNPLVEMYAHGNPIFINVEKMAEEKVIFEQSSLASPNVIVILLESTSAERLGLYGYPRNTTPNIDKLGEKGIVFENAYTTATHSDYAQPTFLSSRYMLSNTYRNFFDESYDRKFVWDAFKKEGYSTGYISSQDDLWAEMNLYYNFSALDLYSHSLTDNETDFGSGLAKKDYDHKTMNKVVSWIDEQDNSKPFFLYTNLQATHTPMSYPQEYAFFTPDKPLTSFDFFGLFGNKKIINRYDNSLRYVDAQVGRLVEELDKKGISNNTVIVISSDHGHDFENRHNVEGHGNSIYNEELKVPLIFYFPDLEPQKVKTPISHIDVLPTLLSIMNMEAPEEFLGNPLMKEKRMFFYAQSHKNFVGMIKNDIKVIIDLNKKTSQVYNLADDPNETKNLIKVGRHDSEILELLMWDYCQKNYFTKEKYDESLEQYCKNF